METCQDNDPSFAHFCGDLAGYVADEESATGRFCRGRLSLLSVS
jgi:hypothetical protein